MKRFLNYTKNKTLNQIKTSPENLWQRTIKLFDFPNTHWCSFWNGRVCLELTESAAGRVVLIQLISINDSAVGFTVPWAWAYEIHNLFHELCNLVCGSWQIEGDNQTLLHHCALNLSLDLLIILANSLAVMDKHTAVVMISRSDSFRCNSMCELGC